MSITNHGDAGELLDNKAKVEYKRKRDDLNAELEEARQFNDLERAASIEWEIDLITQQLKAATGLGGRNRKAADISERIRKNICVRIRYTLKSIEKKHPSLWKHLFNSIKTGTLCSYSPDKPTSWQL